MAVDDRWELQLVTEQSGVAMSNRFFFEEVESPVTPNPLDVWEAWKARTLTPWLQFTAEVAQITCVIAKRVWPMEGPSFTEFVNESGLLPGNPLPTSSHIAFTFNGLFAGPPNQLFRSGILKAGLVEESMDDGNLTMAGAVLAEELSKEFNQLAESPDGGRYLPVIRRLNPGGQDLFATLQQSRIRNIIRSTRRRTTRLCGG